MPHLTDPSIAGSCEESKAFPITKSLQIFCKIRVKVVLLCQFWQNLRFPPHSSTLCCPPRWRAKAEGQQLVHAALDEIIGGLCHDDIQLRSAELKQRLTADPAGRGDLLVHLAAAGAHHAMSVKRVTPSLTALNRAVRSAQLVGVKAAFPHAAGEDAAILGPQGGHPP